MEEGAFLPVLEVLGSVLSTTNQKTLQGISGAKNVLGLHVRSHVAPRGCAPHLDLASYSQRPEVLWLVTGSEASKWGTPPRSLTVLVGWEVQGGLLCSLSSVLP